MKSYQFWQLLAFIFVSHNLSGEVNAILGMIALAISFGAAWFEKPKEKP